MALNFSVVPFSALRLPGGRRLWASISRSSLRGAVAALDATAELLPAVRMVRRRHLPGNMSAGLLGAEMATWWAISPSLLPRPWWVTAADTAVCQALGHATATAVHQLLRRAVATGPVPGFALAHGLLAGITVVCIAVNARRQNQQAALMGMHNRGAVEMAGGIAAGTLGYGALLLLGELSQAGTDRIRDLCMRLLPPWVRWLSWPIAIGMITGCVLILGDRVVLRRMLGNAARNAARLNQMVFPGTTQPREPERSGSPWSLERWGAVGAQGRAVLSGGPRRADIARVTGLSDARVHEPIRIFVGKVPGRSLEEQIRLIIAEVHRTGALRRDTIVITTSTGTGWITDWSTAAVEFLTGGNCATISLQYSYLPSALSWYRDNDAPISAARELIDALNTEIARRCADDTARPRLYLSGESLGAYGTAGAYGEVGELLNHGDGVLLSGTPRFSSEMRALVRGRDTGSPERLPLIDGGRRIRFVAHPGHLDCDYRGRPYEKHWQRPRMIIAAHASDPVVWWDTELFYRCPDWLREPGSRGVAAPDAQRLDVFPRLRWIPFVTGWQIALDLLVSVDVPGGHGHNYHGEFFDYWAALLGRREGVPAVLTPGLRTRGEQWIRENSVKR
ncbi:alpha/beta-hydrolase family protein [Corynebacterium pacaense]|uniref:alpha/beta-hydrolase family protein n=1 Tax=Corynebacterium pacaense TaxID=1816684 RepID=UPI0009BC35A2|nr:alpha/beta-hydrolase family protein [Corynebacterium pacaense]